MSDGVARIAAERERQMAVEGWTPEHDDDYTRGELADAAACYAETPPTVGPFADIPRHLIPPPRKWPWSVDWWKPGDRIRELEKAGALIAAEIDRLLRQRGEARTAEGVGGGALTGECVNCGCELPTGCGGQFADEDACPGYKIVSKSTAPAGIVTVPVQPTDEMLSEGHAAMVEYHKTGSFGECPGIGYGETERCYKAMLAAASAAEKENGK